MKIIFAGTPEISAAVLQTLIDAKFNIVACLTQPDRPQGRGLKLTPSPVKVTAIAANIPVLQPAGLKNPNAQQEIKEYAADLMIVLAYGLILPQTVLDIPKLGCINIHASILPRWRGAGPIQHAILAGDHETGITIMQMDAGMDTGDMLATYPCKISDTDTSADLLQKLTTLAQTAILDSLSKLQAGNLQRIKQDDALATYAHKIDKQQAQIDWDKPAIEIDRTIRAYNPWPVAFTHFGSDTIRVWKAEVIAGQQSSAAPGTIIIVDKQGIQVNTGNGVIRLLTLQFPGKKPLPVNDICHAHPEIKPGARLD